MSRLKVFPQACNGISPPEQIYVMFHRSSSTPCSTTNFMVLKMKRRCYDIRRCYDVKTVKRTSLERRSNVTGNRTTKASWNIETEEISKNLMSCFPHVCLFICGVKLRCKNHHS